MKRKTGIVIYTLAIVILVAIIVFSQNNSQAQQRPPTTTPPTTQDSVTSEVLAQHNTQESCWIAFEGKVYDITSWLPRHPGSAAAIAPYCGTSDEFASAFEGQHGTSQIEKLTEEGIYKGDLQ